jgi:ribose transport system ATP-binding protein
MPALLRLEGICKQYPGVRALDEVTVELRSGEVHCIVGENGAGKSTLIKILSGAITKDRGQILIDGSKASIASPMDALRRGIAIIYQDFKLVPELSVAENIFLGKEPIQKTLPIIDYASMHRNARAQLLQLGEEIDTMLSVSRLSAAQQQIVEIAKALSRRVRILAFDEPSAALTERELLKLFAIIRRLTSEGVGIMYISHRLDEIFEIGDRVTVLRDGRAINTSLIEAVNKKSLIQMMVGRKLEDEFPNVALTRGEEILHVENVSGGILQNVHFSLCSGEILGFAGLIGAGRTEIARIIFGADGKESGSIFLKGKEISPRSPREAIDVGIGLLTENRNRLGLITDMKVAENISLSSLDKLLRGPFLDKVKEVEMARRFVDQLHIKTPGVDEPVENLSGGNRQKVILARWLATKSKVLIFDEPTAGIDVGAKYEIYVLMKKLAQEGVGVIMISSDLPELLGLCDRIIVMRDGRITGELDRDEATQEKIMSLATLEVEEVRDGHE